MIALSTTVRESAVVGSSSSDAHRYLIEHFTRRDGVDSGVLLRVPLADLALDREIVVSLSDLPSKHAEYVMEIGWCAKGGGPYPTFIGSLACLPGDAPASRIELEGTYTIPGGFVGQAFDAVVGHRIALAAAHSLLETLASIVGTARAREHEQQLPVEPKPYPPTYE